MRRGTQACRTAVGLVLGVTLLAAPTATGFVDEPGAPEYIPQCPVRPRLCPPVIGLDFVVSGASAVEDEHGAAVVWNRTEQEYLVIWVDNRYPSRKQDIWGRRVSETGTPVGDDFRVSGPGATDSEDAPAVAWNATDNQYLVVWTDGRSKATRGFDIFGRRLGPSGSPIGSDFRISGVGATGDDVHPDLAWNNNTNQYLVVWEDWRMNPGRGVDIYGRRVSRTGNLIKADVRISGDLADGDEHDPAIDFSSPSNRWMVVWEDRRDLTTGSSDIFGRKVSPHGIPRAKDFRISDRKVEPVSHPDLAWNRTGDQYLVVWEDYRNAPSRGGDIYGRRLLPTGRLLGWGGPGLGADVRISGPEAKALDAEPAVAWSGEKSAGSGSGLNRYLVVWQDARYAETRGWDIFGRHVRGNGALLDRKDFRISGPASTGLDLAPQIAGTRFTPGNPLGYQTEHLVVWGDSRDTSLRGTDIYGRRVGGV